MSGSTLLGFSGAWFIFGGRAGRDSKRASTEELARHAAGYPEALQTSPQIRTLRERQGDEVELRSLEINSRGRSHREEAQHAFDPVRQTDAVHSPEVGPAAQREALKMYAAPLKIAQRFVTKARGFMEREGRLARVEETLRSKAARLAHERAAVQETKKQLEAQRLKFEHRRDRYKVASARMRTEVDAVRHSLAAREAEIRAERERIERDSTVLQDTLGAKAKEMAVREMALAAREAELRAEEEDVEARTRELESKAKWKRSEARLAELKALEANVLRTRQAFESERSAWDVKRSEELSRLEATRDSTAAQAQNAERVIAESQRRALVAEEAEKAARRQAAEVTKQLGLLERRRSEVDESERKARAALARLQEAYAVPLKIARRFPRMAGGFMQQPGRLVRVEETLRSKAASLANERAAVQETGKQLEAQRLELEQLRERYETESVRLRTENDAVLMSVAARESELQVKAQEVEARIRDIESRRSQAEQEAQATLARIQEASQKMVVKEKEVAAATRDLEVRVARMAESEKEAAKTATDLQSLRAELDREVARLANLAEQHTRPQKPFQSRTAISAAKPADRSRKEQTVATEPELADGPMEDVQIRSRFNGPGVRASQDVLADPLMDRVILYILVAMLLGGVLLWLAHIRAP